MFFYKRTIGQRKILKMEKTIEIKRWDNDEVIYSHACENNTIGETVEDAVKNGIDLSYAYLSHADLKIIDLSNAKLSYANLSNANLYFVNLIGVDLSYADLNNANLYNSNLYKAYLINANLTYTNLCQANLSYANLTNANIRSSILSSILDTTECKLTNADLTNIKGLNDQCPKEGSFIGWKKCIDNNNKIRYIVKLEIPADAKRSSATTNKCRCSKAKVLEIQNIDGTKADVARVFSDYDEFFYYQIGEIIYPNSFDNRYWVECSHGIHFFMNREDAVNYKF